MQDNLSGDPNYKGPKSHESNELADKSKTLTSVPIPKTSESKTEYPYSTEKITLPSKGLTYNINDPLSSGIIEMRFMGTKEEDILTSTNLVSKGLAIDMVFQSLIVTDINYDNLLLGDKDTIMLAARILGYGPMFETSIDCPRCNEKQIYEFNLGEFNEKVIDESFLNRDNIYDFTVPSSGKVIKIKFLTHADDKLIEAEKRTIKSLRSKQKIQVKDLPTNEVSLRLKYVIVEVDSKRDKSYIESFITDSNRFRASDSLALRKFIKLHSPGIDLAFDFTCNDCNNKETIDMPVDVNFFWPNTRV